MGRTLPGVIAGFQVQWQVGNAPAGEDTLERMAFAFERAGDTVVDFGKFVFPKLVPVFEAAEKRQFDARGQGPSKGAWAQLSERYEQWKSANYPGRNILERTGRLREALTSSGSPFAMRNVGTSQFDFGTIGLDYASYHQTGTFSMPDRPPFDFGDDFETEARNTAAEGVRDALTEAGVTEFATVEGA